MSPIIVARRTAEPSTWPLELADIRKHLRVEGVTSSDEDAVLDTYIKAATALVENHCRIALIDQTWTGYLDAFPGADEWIELPRPPFISLTTLKYYDTDGVQQTLDKNVYCQLDTYSRPGRILRAYNQTWPSTQPRKQAVEVVWKAGFANAATVPIEIKHAIKLICGQWYENRADVVTGTIVNKDMPWAAQALLAQFILRDAI